MTPGRLAPDATWSRPARGWYNLAMDHVVTQQPPPFEANGGSMVVHQVCAWRDNFAWIFVCTKTGKAAVVDGPESQSVLSYARDRGIEVDTILNTHTHHDHIGINRDLAKQGRLGAFRVIGPTAVACDVPGITERVWEGDRVRVGDLEGEVWVTEGHLDGHISFVFGDVLFCGDTLFAGGCGKLFDGPPAKMFASLSRLAALPEHTQVCCAHEYTQDNLRFAWSVEPDNPALAERIGRAWRTRAEGRATVPSTIGEERRTNPFLRWESGELCRRVQAAWPDLELGQQGGGGDAEAVFAATRALKDRGDYRKSADPDLSL